MAKYRGLFDTIAYSLDFAPTGDIQADGDAATWVDTPVNRIVASTSNLARAEALTQDNINGLPLGAGARQPLGFAFEQHDDDTEAAWLTGLQTADRDGTPVFWRIKFQGSVKEKIVGGQNGTIVAVTSDVLAAFGDLPVHLVTTGATGATGADIYDVYDETLT